MKLNRRKFLRSAAIASGLIWVPDRRILAAPPTAFRAVNTPPSSPSGPSPVFRWKIDEGSGTTTADSSGNGYTGTLNTFGGSNPSWVANGSGISTPATSSPYCLQFTSGNSSYVASASSISQMGSVTTASICGWVYLSSTSNNFAMGLTTTNGYRFDIQSLSGGGYTHAEQGGSNQTYGTFTLAGTGWHFYCAVFNGGLTGNSSRLVLYIDGASTGTSLAFNGTIPASLDTAAHQGDFLLGQAGGTYGTYSTCGLDDVQMFSVALTAAQQTTIYNAGAQ
jgi:hypothetical protein